MTSLTFTKVVSRILLTIILSDFFDFFSHKQDVSTTISVGDRDPLKPLDKFKGQFGENIVWYFVSFHILSDLIRNHRSAHWLSG